MITVSKYKEVSFWDHIQDLRKFFIQCITVFIIVFLCLLPFAKSLYNILSAPLQEILPKNAHIIATEVTTTFLVPMLLTAYVGLLLVAPLIMCLIWNYLKSALYNHEKKLLSIFCSLGLVLFYFGNIFAFYITLPSVLHFFIMMSPDSVLPMTDIYSYFSFCIKLLLVFGIIFEIPLLVLALTTLNIIHINSLKKKRRFIIVGFFFISMFITPPDALSMLLLAIPMCLLFESGLILAKILNKTYGETS
ncbi:twin-arginine translocase subunit TatC [Acinetobacter puyangensis]|uniref:Sec-independent protein translocase protein TatC n=1 Tax=Acinetobacter puyangensis TaxID=1096779 RepID=A0A240E8A8_9GAMM|nr:twin-arginine translocase subunit TatC [Acinetobacter puyangensis]SNX44862.1 Sec-independent protein translocase TatC [Acinetobacter puyangensis]